MTNTVHSAALVDHIATAGRLLYGERWQSDLARALGVSVRTMQNWFADPASSSHRTMPAGVVSDVIDLMQARRRDISTWLDGG